MCWVGDSSTGQSMRRRALHGHRGVTGRILGLFALFVPCLQVLAFGGFSSDEDPEVAYWATRAALTMLPIGPMVVRVAGRLSMVFSQGNRLSASGILARPEVCFIGDLSLRRFRCLVYR